LDIRLPLQAELCSVPGVVLVTEHLLSDVAILIKETQSPSHRQNFMTKKQRQRSRAEKGSQWQAWGKKNVVVKCAQGKPAAVDHTTLYLKAPERNAHERAKAAAFQASKCQESKDCGKGQRRYQIQKTHWGTSSVHNAISRGVCGIFCSARLSPTRGRKK
jgi:hypothetical protein